MAELEGLEPAGEVWRLATSDGEVQARAVILATGARLRTLGVEGEERLQGRGVSHCASCDAPLMRDRTVGVVGGGDSALQEALTLAEAVGEVIVLHRGDALTAQAAYREPALAHPKISVRYGTVVRGDPRRGRRQRRAHARRGVGRRAGPRARRRSSSTSGSRPTASTCATCSSSTTTGASRPTPRMQTAARRRVRGRDRAPRLARAGGHLRRRGRGGGQGGASLPATASRRANSNRHRRPRPPEATEAHMAEKLTVHDPRGYPPQVTGKPLRPAPAEPRGPDALPRRLPVRQLRGLRRPAARVVLRAHARRGRSSASRRARAGSTTPRCARRSRPTGTPPSWRWVFEAPVARRSSGSRRLWRATTGSRRWPCTRTSSPASRARWRAPTACRPPARSSSRSPSSGAPRTSCAPTSTARTPSTAGRSCSSSSRA